MSKGLAALETYLAELRDFRASDFSSPSLDANYCAVKKSTYKWPGKSDRD